jgi:hypothetical protein
LRIVNPTGSHGFPDVAGADILFKAFRVSELQDSAAWHRQFPADIANGSFVTLAGSPFTLPLFSRT